MFLISRKKWLVLWALFFIVVLFLLSSFYIAKREGTFLIKGIPVFEYFNASTPNVRREDSTHPSSATGRATTQTTLSPDQLDIRWKLYGENSAFSQNDLKHFLPKASSHPLEPNGFSPAVCKKNSKLLLDNLSSDFQKNILAGISLTCYSQSEGIFFKKYVKFLNALSRYTESHRIMSNDPNNSRTLVWMCPVGVRCGGIADRLKGMSFALLIAVISQRRLLLDWQSPERVHFKPNMINWIDKDLHTILYPTNSNQTIVTPRLNVKEFTVYTTDNNPFMSLSQKQWENFLDVMAGKEKVVTMVTNLEVSLISQTSRASTPWLAKGYESIGLSHLSGHELDDIVGIVLRYLFQFEKNVLREFSKAKEALKLTGHVFTGIHLRTGFIGVKQVNDYVVHKKLLKGEHLWKAALQCAVHTADKHLGNDSLIFLATDSYVVKDIAVKTWGARFRSLNNYLIHMDKMDRARKLKRQEKEGALYAIIDLLFLAESYVLVRGYSGYSWLASLLCSLPNEHLIDNRTCKKFDVSKVHV